MMPPEIDTFRGTELRPTPPEPPRPSLGNPAQGLAIRGSRSADAAPAEPVPQTDFRRRSLRIERGEIDAESRSIPLSVSSDTDKVERYVSGYGWVREVLSHASGAVDLSRFNGEHGGPLLYNHSSARLIGRFKASGLEGGKLRGVARFGKSPEADSAWRDVMDDVLVDVSISYDYDLKDVEVSERDTNGKVTAVRVKRWIPYEVSFVTVPADANVGIGRDCQCCPGDRAAPPPMLGLPGPGSQISTGDSAHHPAGPRTPAPFAGEPRSGLPHSTTTNNPTNKEGRSMPPEENTQPGGNQAATPPPAPQVNVQEIRAAAVKAEQERVGDILALCERFSVQPEKRKAWLDSGTPVDAIRAEILEGINKTKPLPPMSDQLGLTDSERSKYSFARAVQALLSRDFSQAGFEREVSEAVSKKLGRSSGGFLIPSDIKIRAANTMATNAAGAGQELVWKDYMGFLEMLKNEAVVLQMGARILSGLQGNPTWVKQTGQSQIYWVGENPGNDVQDSKLGFSIVSATPKTAKSLMTYTRQQVLQSIEAFEPLVQSDVLENDGLAVDLASLTGTGTNFQPTGLLNTAGIAALALGANGGVPNYKNLTALKTLVKKANAMKLGVGGYLTTPDIQDLLENTPRLANTIAQAIWENDRVAGFKAFAGNQVPSNLTKGTATNCSAVIFGIWSELFILEWGALEMTVDPFTLMGQDVVRVGTSHILDIFVRRPQAFAAIKDALAA